MALVIAEAPRKALDALADFAASAAVIFTRPRAAAAGERFRAGYGPLGATDFRFA